MLLVDVGLLGVLALAVGEEAQGGGEEGGIAGGFVGLGVVLCGGEFGVVGAGATATAGVGGGLFEGGGDEVGEGHSDFVYFTKWMFGGWLEGSMMMDDEGMMMEG